MRKSDLAVWLAYVAWRYDRASKTHDSEYAVGERAFEFLALNLVEKLDAEAYDLSLLLAYKVLYTQTTTTVITIIVARVMHSAIDFLFFYGNTRLR